VLAEVLPHQVEDRRLARTRTASEHDTAARVAGSANAAFHGSLPGPP
jgi:hypothetical protein